MSFYKKTATIDMTKVDAHGTRALDDVVLLQHLLEFGHPQHIKDEEIDADLLVLSGSCGI